MVLESPGKQPGLILQCLEHEIVSLATDKL